MTLTLRIVNMTTLPDGGQVEFTCNQGRFELGRDTAMDWTLPDPNRFVSSCHADIRWESGAYWLYDVSTNGTFVNGASMRVKSPYQLQNGDKLQIGHYLVEVQVAAASQPGSGAVPPGPQATDPFAAAGSEGGFGGPSSSPFGAAAPSSDLGGGYAASDPFGGAPGGSGDPFGSDPFGGGGSGAGGAFSVEDDPWAVPGVPAADPGGFDRPGPALSQGDAGDELIGFDFDPPATSPSALGASDASPFGAPAAPGGGSPGAGSASQDASPFGAPAAQGAAAPQAPTHAPSQSDSPFGAAPGGPAQGGAGAAQTGFGQGGTGGGDASPFADSRQTTPPGHTPGAAMPPRAAPPSEGFGAPAAQRPAPATPPAPALSQGAPGSAANDAILRAICEGAGLPPDALSGADPRATGYEIGQSLRIVAAELAAVLKVRSKSKRLYEKSGRTEIGREDNNPLKFTPTPDEALKAMFGPVRPGFMRGPQTMQASFDDIKRHQFAIQAALQPALAKLIDDLRPEAIEDKVGSTRFGSKSAKAWELFVERWDAKTHPYENGMLDVFQAYFAEAYNKASNGN